MITHSLTRRISSFSKLTCTFACALCTATLVAAVDLRSPIAVSRLRCEHLTFPQGIDTTVPRLSWIVESDWHPSSLWSAQSERIRVH